MNIKSSKASSIYKLTLAIIGTIALAYSAKLFEGYFRISFLYKFTNLSNLVLVIYFWAASIRQFRGLEPNNEPYLPKVKHALLLAISVTCLVAHFLLDNGMVFKDGIFQPDMLALHYIVPIGAILDWIIFDKKGFMSFSEPPAWLIFPLVYLAYAFLMVLGFGVNMSDASRWPYPFLDLDAKGIPGVATMIAILLVAFIILGFIYVAIDKLMSRK